MDSCSPQNGGSQIKVMKGTQIGGSSIADNIALCYLDMYPCPILYITPNQDLAKGTSQRRITPAIREIEGLRKKILGGKSKDDVGEMFTKRIPGGGLTFGWSNSTSSFRSFSARIVILDDVDGFGVFGEGNVIALGKKRADAFPNDGIIYINSTPTNTGASNIEKEYAESDKREYFMKCPECSEMVVFRWDNFVFDHDNYKLKGDVTFGCPSCGSSISERYKRSMMSEDNGARWIPQNPGHEHKGYLIPSYYSPWVSWKKIASEFLEAVKFLKQGDEEYMRVWQNTRNARPFLKKLAGVDIVDRNKRVEDYGAEVPNAVKILTAGVDTQDNRFEILVLGWSNKNSGELYVIDYKVIMGDPQFVSTQDELDEYLSKSFTRADGGQMRIQATGVDTGGHRGKAIDEYVKYRLPDRIFGIKGSSVRFAPVINKTMMQLTDRNLVIVGTVAIKDNFYGKLAITEPGVNFVHFPDISIIDKRFFDMLTAEKRDDKGLYVQIRTRNESIDCMVYAIAAIDIIMVNVDTLTHPILHVGEQVISKQGDEDGVSIGSSFDSYMNEY